MVSLRFSKILSKSFLLLVVVLWNARVSVGYAKLAPVSVTQLTFDKGANQQPTWSPNGSRIAYMRGGEIWSVALDGQGKTLIASLEYTEGLDLEWPKWNPLDANQLIASGFDFIDGGGRDLYKIDCQGTTTKITSNGESVVPSWKPDGSRIVFSIGDYSGFLYEGNGTRDFDLWTIKPDGSELHRLYGQRGVWEWQAAWSPDGKRIAYVASLLSTNPVRYSHEIRILDMATLESELLLSLGSRWPTGLSWTPSGDGLVFSMEGHIWYVNSDGSGLEVLIEEDGASYPSVSPDGLRLAFQKQVTYPDPITEASVNIYLATFNKPIPEFSSAHVVTLLAIVILSFALLRFNSKASQSRRS